MKVLLCAILLASAGWAQTAAQASGFESEWDLRKLLTALTDGARRLRPILDQSDPGKWSDSTAAQSYSPQWKTALSEIQYLDTTTAAFAKQPERLTLALESYFRLQAMETTLSSLMEGMRKHGNPAVADLLAGTLRANAGNRDRLRQYISELAQSKEQECQVMDKEAQRCRAILSKQPPPVRERAKPKQE